MRVTALVLAAVMTTTACGSLNKTAGNSIIELKAAYTAANNSRTDYCRGVPEPKPVDLCKKEGSAYKVLLGSYEAIKTGSQLLATYEASKSADAAGKLKAFLPVITMEILEIAKIVFPLTPQPNP